MCSSRENQFPKELLSTDDYRKWLTINWIFMAQTFGILISPGLSLNVVSIWQKATGPFAFLYHAS